jgi:hypothetical protein
MMATTDPSKWTLPRLAIDREGAWFHDGEEVTHEGMLATLRSDLRRDAQGHYLQIGIVRVPVEVEDAPFVVVRLEREGDRLAVWLSDGTREPLDPGTLETRGDVPYARVKAGRFGARFSRAAAWQLWQIAEYDEARASASLVLAGRRHVIPASPGSPTA